MKLNLSDEFLRNCKPLSEEEVKEWDRRLKIFYEELGKDMDPYIEKMRKAKAKSWMLARTRVLC